jgi:membrane-associated phospholipid phosphatase
VTAATAVAIAGAAEISAQLSPRERKLLWTAVTLLSVSVGWSRLYLDEHWIDDVVGGWMAGISIGLGSASLVKVRE